MTSHWDAETCLWPFQLRSLYSSLRDLNGLLGGQNGSRDEQFGLSWQSQRASVVSLMCTICIEGPPWQFDALLARLYQQSMLIFATIILDHPKSALEPFQRGSSRYVFSNDSSSLAYWNLRWTVLKSYILPQRHKWLISSI